MKNLQKNLKMNNHDEIKKLLSASRIMLSNPTLNESIDESEKDQVIKISRKTLNRHQIHIICWTSFTAI